MEAIVTAVTTASEMIFGQIGNVVECIVEHPILLLPVACTFVGMALGYAKSLIRV